MPSSSLDPNDEAQLLYRMCSPHSSFVFVCFLLSRMKNSEPPTTPSTVLILRIAVGSKNPVKINAVQRAIEQVLESLSTRKSQKSKQEHQETRVELQIESFDVPSGVSNQPVGDVSLGVVYPKSIHSGRGGLDFLSHSQPIVSTIVDPRLTKTHKTKHCQNSKKHDREPSTEPMLPMKHTVSRFILLPNVIADRI